MGLFSFGNRRRARVVCSGPQSGPSSGNFRLVRFSVARTAAWSWVVRHRLSVAGSQRGPWWRTRECAHLRAGPHCAWSALEAHRRVAGASRVGEDHAL